MPDPIAQTYNEVRSLAQDYFDLAESEAEILMKLAKKCALTTGIPLAGAGAVALAVAGSPTIIGSVPGYVAGALAGFVGGMTACMITRRSVSEHVRQVIGQSKMSEKEFKSEVRRLISVADGKSGYCQVTT